MLRMESLDGDTPGSAVLNNGMLDGSWSTKTETVSGGLEAKVVYQRTLLTPEEWTDEH